MEAGKPNTFLEEALHYFNFAEAELNRPQEDVVAYCACHFTRKSVHGLFKAYLLTKNKSIREDETIEELHKRCAGLDAGFARINISCFSCRGGHQNVCDELYCNTVENINTCYAAANEVKMLVLSSINAVSGVNIPNVKH